jgi:hypothetical protein
MALNPFTSFRKYQRFWMATVLLLTMVTFVLCTGTGGDLTDRLIKQFAPREGSPLAIVGGRKIYNRELSDLKDQRNMVNEFMKRACELALKNIHDIENNEKLTPEQRQKELPKLALPKQDLEARWHKAKYFGSGVKLDELVDFKVWLLEADRLGIKLLPEHVQILLNIEMLSDFTLFQARNREQMYSIIRDLRQTGQRITTEATVISALTDEFRVRLAQQALEYVDPLLFRRGARDPKLQTGANPEVRVALTPAMLWTSFEANRSEFDVTLVPVAVDHFVDQVPAPTEAELKSLFADHYKEKYDPTSPTPGFEIPTSTRVELVIGDPTAPNFKQWSEAAIILEATPPAWIPAGTLPTLVRYLAGPLAQHKVLEFQYNQVRNRYRSAPWSDPDLIEAMDMWLAGPHADAAVSWIAGYAQPSNLGAHLSYLALGQYHHPNELATGLTLEAKTRTPVYATWILANGPGTPFQSWGMFVDMHRDEQFIPLEVVRADVIKYLERHQAGIWVNANMNALRAKLNEFAGNKYKFERELKNSLDKMGLERRTTKDFYDRFSIDKAPELQPLLQSFNKYFGRVNTIEGRDLNPESMLKEGDFYKLFFDGAESFSAFQSTYKARPWPPVVTAKRGFWDNDGRKAPPLTDLFADADKPMLFWKIEDKVGKVPESIDLVRDRVARAWKLLTARDTKALPKAQSIAELLQKSEEGFAPVLAIQAFSTPLIKLEGLAKMYTKEPFQRAFGGPIGAFTPGRRSYSSFTLPKDTFVYPRDDMAQEILSLPDLKKPLETGDSKLDAINKTLFDEGVKSRRVVQILTNKPRSIFYVACVTRLPIPSMPEFHSVLKFAYESPVFQSRGSYVDFFFDEAYEEAGKEHRRALMEQLRRDTDSSILAEPNERKSFDANETS